ncbi:lasso peptide biosynthesis B2 protein [Streptomyces sp. WZ-12]|uniref:lasso peptide biosynthesis B2 protein n=1 Tax=Streptomyces sp. WZ-12 TaxID=3030210 RepID=UPI00238172BC|nr:lasso peptide biosynthesis B2 protein [Streptomyces sp. WZ-12]
MPPTQHGEALARRSSHRTAGFPPTCPQHPTPHRRPLTRPCRPHSVAGAYPRKGRNPKLGQRRTRRRHGPPRPQPRHHHRSCRTHRSPHRQTARPPEHRPAPHHDRPDEWHVNLSPPATHDQAEAAVRAVHRAGWYSPARTAFLEESAAAVLLLASRRLSVTWCHGVAPDPRTTPRLGAN